MNRHQRRKLKSSGEPAEAFRPKDTLSQEAMQFSADLQVAIHSTMERSKEYMPDGDELITMGRVVQGLGVSAAAFALGVGATEKHFVDAMRLYFQQTKTELDAANAATAAERKQGIIKAKAPAG